MRAQGRRATRLRYAPTYLTSHYSSAIYEYVFSGSRSRCAKTVPEWQRACNRSRAPLPLRVFEQFGSILRR